MKNESGLWKLSPSGLYNYEQCKACFWLEQHYGRAPMIPFVLNSAMDSVLKARYDLFRSYGGLPPEIEALTKEGVKPFTDTVKLNKWRSYSSSLAFSNVQHGYELAGKVDEILIEPDKRLIPTDFKTSGYMPKADKQKYYISQLNAYALMLQEAGEVVSDRAILIHYYIKNVRDTSISVEFLAHTDMVKLDVTAFKEKLKSMVALLNAPYPGDGEGCDTCAYHKGRVGAII